MDAESLADGYFSDIDADGNACWRADPWSDVLPCVLTAHGVAERMATFHGIGAVWHVLEGVDSFGSVRAGVRAGVGPSAWTERPIKGHAFRVP
jgi:hypothetical protein